MKKTHDNPRIFADFMDADGRSVVVVQHGTAEKRCWVSSDDDPYLTAKLARKLAKGLLRFAEWAEKP